MFKKMLIIAALLAVATASGGAAEVVGGIGSAAGQPGNTVMPGQMPMQMPGQMPMQMPGQMPGQMQMPMGQPMGGMGNMGNMGGMGGMGMPGMGMGQQMQMPNISGNYMGQMQISGRQYTIQAMLQQQGAQVGGQVAIPELGGQAMPIAFSIFQNGVFGLGFNGMGTGGMVSMVLTLMPTPNGLQGMAGDATTGQMGQIVLQRAP